MWERERLQWNPTWLAPAVKIVKELEQLTAVIKQLM
jgi:hypothetical protein